MDMPQYESFEELADATASGLVQIAAGEAFRLFRDKKFRRLANFSKIHREEHDRIFNELVCAYIVLIMLILEAPDLRVDSNMKNYFTDLKNRIPNAYLEHLKSIGIEDKYLSDWETLLKMRYEEYARDRHGVRAAAMEIEAADKELTLEDLSNIQLLVPVHAVAIGTHDHNVRGKTKGRDELFKYTFVSLSRFYVDMRIRFEGGKITPFAKLQVALKKLFNKL
jgi:hypothetical protein